MRGRRFSGDGVGDGSVVLLIDSSRPSSSSEDWDKMQEISEWQDVVEEAWDPERRRLKRGIGAGSSSMGEEVRGLDLGEEEN